MLASVQNTTSAAPVAHSRFGLGASDGTTEGSSAFQDQNGAGTMSVDAIDKTSKVFMKVDNNTPAIDAEADLTAIGADGFIVELDDERRGGRHEILYLSLAPLAVTEVRLISFTASRETQGVHLAWRTGYEVSNLGFHLYREIDGRRTRITRSLVAGSGLTVGARNRVTTEQNYSYWDRDGRRAIAAGGVLARGRRLQRQEHVARAHHAGWRARPARRAACRRQSAARGTRPWRRAPRGTVLRVAGVRTASQRSRASRGPADVDVGVGPDVRPGGGGRGASAADPMGDRRSAGGEDGRARVGLVSREPAGARSPRV